tara:strand:+ start:347 stop:481 length:135 start_codon:yes stop_codon:yes gene_type:complete
MIDALIVVGVIVVFGILVLASRRLIPSNKKKETSAPPDEIYPLF